MLCDVVYAVRFGDGHGIPAVRCVCLHVLAERLAACAKCCVLALNASAVCTAPCACKQVLVKVLVWAAVGGLTPLGSSTPCVLNNC